MHKLPLAKRAINIEYAIRDVVLPAQKLEEAGQSIAKLNIGDPIAYPSFKTPSHMIEAYIDSLKNQKNGYSDSYGIEALREAIADDESNKSNGGWKCTPDNVYICHGVTEALQILFASILEQGDKILAPGPHYPPYMAYPQMYGASTIEYKLNAHNKWQIDLDDIRSKMDEKVKMLVVINPNNPTGGVSDKNTLKELIKILSDWPSCVLISDEIYDAINFNNNHFSLASLADKHPVITLNGVSKVYYAPGWRIGYMAWHDPENVLSLVKEGVEKLLRSRLSASTPAQYGYLAGLTSSKVWMKEYQSILRKRRDFCINCIDSISGLSVESPEGAFYMFIKINHDYWHNNDKQFCIDLLNKKHILTVHGSGFSKKYGKNHFRIVFLPELEILEKSFQAIDELIKSY